MRWLGNLIEVAGVPGLPQVLDWIAHRITGAAITSSAPPAVCVFAAFSALFHLHVMRNGVFPAGTGRYPTASAVCRDSLQNLLSDRWSSWVH
ncbi:MAG: hypothetical protein ABR905_16845 [Terracidiphilus sp.]